MDARFYVQSTISDITDFRVHLFGYLIGGNLKEGMIAKLPKIDINDLDTTIQELRYIDLFTRLEGKPYYTLLIDTDDLPKTEEFYSQRHNVEGTEIWVVEPNPYSRS